MSRKLLLRERSRMTSELLKSSEDAPSKDIGGVEFKMLCILEIRSADVSNSVSRV